MAERREFLFTGLVSVVDNADGTQTVTVTGTPSSPTFDSDVLNPGVNSTGPGEALPSNTPAGWLELAPGTGKWLPYWVVNT